MTDTTVQVATDPLSTKEISTTIERRAQPVSSLGDEPLTNQQKELVEKTWSLVEPDLQGAGIQLFKKIFEIAPEALQLFPKFHDVPLEQLENDEFFRAHALQVTEAVSLAVSALDDLPSLVLVLKDLGAAHSAHGIQGAHFNVVGQALLWTLEQALGNQFTPEVKEAWTTCYAVIAAKMKEGLQHAYAIRRGEA